MLLQFLYLFLPLTAGFLALFVCRFGLCGKNLFKLTDNRSQRLGSKLDRLGLRGFVLCDDLVNLLQQDTYLLLQLRTVLLHGLAPYEGVFVGLGLYLGAVDVLNIQSDKTFIGQDQHYLCENVVYLILDAVAEAVDRDEVRALLRRQPYIMNIALKLPLYLPAGVDVVHIGVDNHLEHHLRMIRAATLFLVQFPEVLQVKTLDHTVNHANRVVPRYILIGIDHQKQPVVIVRFCM